MRVRVPEIDDELAEQVARVVRSIRELELKKAPSISETIDWARTLLYLGTSEITPAVVGETLHVLLKYQSDILKARKELVPPPTRADARRPPGLRPRATRRRAAGVDDREPRRHAGPRARRHQRPRQVPRPRSARPSSSTTGTGPRSTPSSTCTSRSTAAAIDADDPNAEEWAELLGQQGEAAGGGAGGELSREELAEMLLHALMTMDRDELRRLAAAAVSQFAGMEPGRPVGGTYYLYRTLRQLDLDDLAARLVGRARDQGEVPDDPLGARLQEEEFQSRLRELRELIESEIRRRLVADRGVEAMARTLRKPLPEDVDFMHASREEMLALQRAIYPLTRSLAARLAQRRRRRHRGQPRLPKDRARVALLRRRPRGTQVPPPAPVPPRDHGRRRHLGLGGQLRPLHLAVRLRDGQPVLEGPLVGVHRRHRRGHPVLPGLRRRHRRRPPGQHRGGRGLGRRALRLRPRLHRRSTTATSGRSPRRRR